MRVLRVKVLQFHSQDRRLQFATILDLAGIPMPDSIELAAEAGIVAIVQPGGSRRDADVIGREKGSEHAVARILHRAHHPVRPDGDHPVACQRHHDDGRVRIGI